MAGHSYKDHGEKRRDSRYRHQPLSHSRGSLTASDSNMTDTPFSSTTITSTSDSGTLLLSSSSSSSSGHGGTKMRAPDRSDEDSAANHSANQSASTAKPSLMTSTGARVQAQSNRCFILAPPATDLYEDTDADRVKSDKEQMEKDELLPSSMNLSFFLKGKQSTDVFCSPSLLSSAKRGTSVDDKTAQKQNVGVETDESSDPSLPSRAQHDKCEHNLKSNLPNEKANSPVLAYRQQVDSQREQQQQERRYHSVGQLRSSPLGGMNCMGPLPRSMIGADGGGSALTPTLSAIGSPRGASPRMWPYISPGSFTSPLALFTPTLSRVPGRVGSKPLEEAPAGSVVAAIKTQPEEVHPTVAEIERRQGEGRLAYPSRMTFGYYGLVGGPSGSPANSQWSSSIALRHAGSGGVFNQGGAPRGPPVMQSVESQVPVKRQPGFPPRRALMRRRQHQHEQAELGALARERTHTAILRSHHVPLVPFSTKIDAAEMPFGAPTVEEAVAQQEYDEDGYYSSNANGVIEAPQKLQRAMTRPRVRPTSPAINAIALGAGGFKTRTSSSGVFNGVTNYLFGRRAGGGAFGGGRSAFLNDADPSQFWAAQLSAQTHLHLDPLFPEQLMIDDLADDYYCAVTSSPRLDCHSPRCLASASGGGVPGAGTRDIANRSSTVLANSAMNHNLNLGGTGNSSVI